MYISVTHSKPVLPFTADDLTERDEQALLAASPFIDLRALPSEQEIFVFLQALFAHYFQIPAETITHESRLLEDIEKAVWSKELAVPVEEVTYERIFCGKDAQGNAVGGLSDKGLIMTTLFMFDFPTAIGIHEVENAREAVFETSEGEFNGYAECQTVRDLLVLIWQVVNKLQCADSGQCPQ